jgi:hypothetical protein
MGRTCIYRQRLQPCEGCQISHKGCDEKTPTCGNCERYGWNCSLSQRNDPNTVASLQRNLSERLIKSGAVALKMPSPAKFVREGQVFDTLSFYLHTRVVELFGDPKSYGAFSTPKFSNSVGITFSKTIPQIAKHVGPFLSALRIMFTNLYRHPWFIMLRRLTQLQILP